MLFINISQRISIYKILLKPWLISPLENSIIYSTKGQYIIHIVRRYYAQRATYKMSLHVLEHLQGRQEGNLRGYPFLPLTLSHEWRKYNGNIYPKSR